MRKPLHLSDSKKQEDVEPRKRSNIAFSAYMHYFFRKQTSFLGKKKNLFMNFVVQKILFPQEMLRVRRKQEENLRNCFRKDVSSFSRT